MDNDPSSELRICLIPPDLLKPDHGIDLSNSYRLRLEKQGRFPKRVRLTTRRYAYRWDEIRAYTAARIAERDAKNAA
jgi:predicted DNA-binding transcriptional regulator AlpA